MATFVMDFNQKLEVVKNFTETKSQYKENKMPTQAERTYTREEVNKFIAEAIRKQAVKTPEITESLDSLLSEVNDLIQSNSNFSERAKISVAQLTEAIPNYYKYPHHQKSFCERLNEIINGEHERIKKTKSFSDNYFNEGSKLSIERAMTKATKIISNLK